MSEEQQKFVRRKEPEYGVIKIKALKHEIPTTAKFAKYKVSIRNGQRQRRYQNRYQSLLPALVHISLLSHIQIVIIVLMDLMKSYLQYVGLKEKTYERATKPLTLKSENCNCTPNMKYMRLFLYIHKDNNNRTIVPRRNVHQVWRFPSSLRVQKEVAVDNKNDEVAKCSKNGAKMSLHLIRANPPRTRRASRRSVESRRRGSSVLMPLRILICAPKILDMWHPLSHCEPIISGNIL
ncbi:hypothetical protein K501DRAFT_270156 [Backusella circina FSU 941]|nr:hypothetical protein K501DRAFT_270156 [Backusella circina FSU 941]